MASTRPIPRKLELMRSYAASEWSTLWRVKFPCALPYLFSAFKVAATASVVGAIIGELPSSIQDGLGGAILNFAQYYSLDPSALWATNIIAAALGILFFAIVAIAEQSRRPAGAGERRMTERRRGLDPQRLEDVRQGRHDGARRTSSSSSSPGSSSR